MSTHAIEIPLGAQQLMRMAIRRAFYLTILDDRATPSSIFPTSDFTDVYQKP